MNAKTKAKLESNIKKYYLIGLLAGFAFFFNEIPVLYYQHFNLSFSQISIIAITISATTLIFQVPSGAFADLHGRKTNTFLATVFLAASLIVFAVSSTLLQFIVASVLMGLSWAFWADRPLLYDSLKELGREKDYLKIISKTEAIFLSVGILAAYFGPYLFSYNVRFPYYVSAFSALFLTIVPLTFYEPKIEHKEKITLKKHCLQMKEGLLFTLERSKLVWLIMISALIVIVGDVFAGLISAPYIIEIGFTLKQLGVIAFIATTIQTITVFFADKIERKIGEKKSFFLIVVSVFLMFLGIYYARDYLLILFFAVFWSAMSFREMVIESYINRHLHKKNRATVLSIYSMSLAVLRIMFMPVFGHIIDATSLSFTILVLAMMTLVVGAVLLFVRYSRRVWKSLD